MTDGPFATIPKALEAIARGQMVVLVDDEDRENEGDLCMAAEFATAEKINFMAREARGLICLTLTPATVNRLELAMMVEDNRSPRRTAFTVSIEAREGVTTGISAADRAHTVRTAVADDARPGSLVSPGHVFPLRAKPGGVLQRTGHTEGSIDLARLAGCKAAAVICEIMNDDGTMARLPELRAFAQRHQIPVVSIAQLVEYRMQKERLVRKLGTKELSLNGERWRAHAYESTVENREALALTRGVLTPELTLVRVHTGTFFGDMLQQRKDGQTTVHEALHSIASETSGVLLFFPNRGKLSDELKGEPPQTSPSNVLREFGLGAQILRDLGLRKIRLLTKHPLKMVGLDGYGLEVVEQVSPDTVTAGGR